jgi:hypothetical protein
VQVQMQVQVQVCLDGWRLPGQAEPVLKAPPSQAPQERPIPAYELMQAWHGNRDAILIIFLLYRLINKLISLLGF